MWHKQNSNAPQKKMSVQMDELLSEIQDWVEAGGVYIEHRVREDRVNALKKLIKRGLVKRDRMYHNSFQGRHINRTIIVPLVKKEKIVVEKREPYKKRNTSLDKMGLKRRKT